MPRINKEVLIGGNRHRKFQFTPSHGFRENQSLQFFKERPLVTIICMESKCREQIKMSLLAGTYAPNYSLIHRAVSEKKNFKEFAAIFKKIPLVAKI